MNPQRAVAGNFVTVAMGDGTLKTLHPLEAVPASVSPVAIVGLHSQGLVDDIPTAGVAK